MSGRGLSQTHSHEQKICSSGNLSAVTLAGSCLSSSEFAHFSIVRYYHAINLMSLAL